MCKHCLGDHRYTWHTFKILFGNVDPYVHDIVWGTIGNVDPYVQAVWGTIDIYLCRHCLGTIYPCIHIYVYASMSPPVL